MMKRAIMLAIVALFAVGTAASAVLVSTTIYGAGNANFVAAPLVPFDPVAQNVFMDDQVPPQPINIAGGCLYRWDAAGQGWVIYGIGTYGGILLGDGQVVTNNLDNNIVWQYDGAPDGLPDAGNVMTDMWISLPQSGGGDGGATLFGTPFNHKVLLANCLVTDGTQTVSFLQAATNGWVDAWVWGYDNEFQGWVNVSTPNGVLEPFKGYSITSYVDNLALIVQAYPVIP